MDLTVQNVYGLLLRSRLMPLEEARAMFDRWNNEAGDNAKNVVKFARWMVEHGFLTDYQATLLARGYADGFHLNQYRILDRLGKGRMAGVYLAQHEKGAPVAIKVLPPSKARDPDLLSRFHREARLAVRLQHPNVVRTFEVGKTEATSSQGELYFLVMEHLEGETLEDLLLRKKRFSPPEAVRLIHQALQGLQHIHEQGLVHRDLKPSNMMLAYDRSDDGKATSKVTLKILDLGLSRALGEVNEVHQSTTETGLTQEGVILGTPDYMAPEQAKDARNADIRSDIYSLGCVLYHLLTGRPPYPDENVISQMIRHATEVPTPIQELNPEVPEGLQQIVDWMMAKDPKQRYQSPLPAASALELFLAAGAATASSPDLDPNMKPYLQWLEAKSDKGTVKMKASATQETLPKKNKQTPKSSPTVDQSKPRKPKPKPVRKAAPSTYPADVELIEMELSRDQPQKLFSLPLSRRDLAMCGIGALLVIIAIGIGLLAAMLFGAFN